MIKHLKTTRKTGYESFIGLKKNLLDYWSWAHSDISSNSERGKLAEYLVSIALNSNSHCRTEWDSVDVVSSEGIRVEVKSSAYLQTWKQNKLSTIQFDISPKFAWNSETNAYSELRLRSSDVYVFCLFACKDAEKANPLNTNQWEFYVLSTKVLNDRIPTQKTITLNSLNLLGAEKVPYSLLRQAIINAYT